MYIFTTIIVIFIIVILNGEFSGLTLSNLFLDIIALSYHIISGRYCQSQQF